MVKVAQWHCQLVRFVQKRGQSGLSPEIDGAQVCSFGRWVCVLTGDEQFILHRAAFKIAWLLAVRCQGALYVSRIMIYVLKVAVSAC